MMKSIEEAREHLRGTQAVYRAQLTEIQDAKAAAQKAADLVRAAETELSKFNDLDKRIARERANGIKAAARNGVDVLPDLSPELRSGEAQKHDAANKLKAAKLALSEIEGDLRELEAVAETKADSVRAAASDVASLILRGIMVRLEELESEADKLRIMFGASLFWKTGWPQFAFKPVRFGSGVTNQPRQLPTADMEGLLRKLHDTPANARDIMHNSDRAHQHEALSKRWTEFSEALFSNADALPDFD